MIRLLATHRRRLGDVRPLAAGVDDLAVRLDDHQIKPTQIVKINPFGLAQADARQLDFVLHPAAYSAHRFAAAKRLDVPAFPRRLHPVALRGGHLLAVDLDGDVRAGRDG